MGMLLFPALVVPAIHGEDKLWTRGVAEKIFWKHNLFFLQSLDAKNPFPKGEARGKLVAHSECATENPAVFGVGPKKAERHQKEKQALLPLLFFCEFGSLNVRGAQVVPNRGGHSWIRAALAFELIPVGLERNSRTI